MAQHLSALEAALLILKHSEEPLHYEEITRRILEQELWETSGKTPAATLSARISQSVKKLGPASPFVHTSPGHYALNPTPAPAHPEQKPQPVPANKLKQAQLVTKPVKSQALSFTEAAERVLEGSASKQLHYRDITRIALEKHLVDTSGKTPEATMYAQILTEVKRRRQTPRSAQ